MASIRRHPNAKHRWQVRYRDPTGRQRTKNFAKKSDAERYAAIVEADKLRGAWTDPSLSRVTLSTWASEWLESTIHIKPKTREGYISLLRTHIEPAFGDVALGRVRQVEVRSWVASLSASGLSPSRVRQAYRLLSAIYRGAVESGYLAKSPCVGIELPRIQRNEMRFLDADEIDRLATEIREPYGTMVYVLGYCGLRWGEAAALRRSRCLLLRSRLEIAESLADVSGQLHFGPTKTYEQRTVILPAFLRERLAAHLARSVIQDTDALVFTSDRGQPLRNANFNRRVWHPAAERAGLVGVRLHDLRHSAAAMMIAENAHPKAVQVALGHSSIAVTMDRYGHLFPSDQEALADRLDARYRASQPSDVDRLWTGGGRAG